MSISTSSTVYERYAVNPSDLKEKKNNDNNNQEKFNNKKMNFEPESTNKYLDLSIPIKKNSRI